jgi:hypothetical protein
MLPSVASLIARLMRNHQVYSHWPTRPKMHIDLDSYNEHNGKDHDKYHKWSIPVFYKVE